VLFANFAEAVAEGRGKAQADTLRRSRKEAFAHLLKPDGTTEEIPSTQLRVGNLAVVTAGQVVPGDGDAVEGMAVVDESAITGESAPVIRESGHPPEGHRQAGHDRAVQRPAPHGHPDRDDHRRQPAHRQGHCRGGLLIGRFAPIVLSLGIAGSLAGTRVHASTRATLDTSGPTFVAFLLGVIVIVGGLIYFPMLILGPIGERIVG
jgi:hypothetical protein